MAVTKSVTFEKGYNPSEEKKKELIEKANQDLSQYTTTNKQNFSPVREELYQAIQKGEDTAQIVEPIKKTTQEIVKEQRPGLVQTTEEQRKQLLKQIKGQKTQDVLGRNETISGYDKSRFDTNGVWSYLNKAWGNVVDYFKGNDGSVRNTIINNEGDRQSYWRNERLLNNYVDIVVDQPDILTKEEYKVPTSTIGRLQAGMASMAPTILYDILPQAVSSASQYIGSETGNQDLVKWGEKFGVQTSLNFAKSKTGQVIASTEKFAEGGWTDPVYYTNAVANTVGSFGTVIGGAIAGSLLTGNPAVGTAVGIGVGFTQEASNMYTDLLDRGYRSDQALSASTLYGVASTVLENAIGIKPAQFGGNLLKQGLKETVVELTSKPLYKELIKGIKESAKTGLEEGIEETLQQLTQNAITQVLDKNQQLAENLLDSFVMGGVGGFVASGTRQAQKRTNNFLKNNTILRNTPSVDTKQFSETLKQYQQATPENKVKLQKNINAGVASLIQPISNIKTDTTDIQASIIPLDNGFTYQIKGKSGNLVINDSGVDNNQTFKTREEVSNFITKQLEVISDNPLVSKQDSILIKNNSDYTPVLQAGKKISVDYIQKTYSSINKQLEQIGNFNQRLSDYINNYHSALSNFDNSINKVYTEYQYNNKDIDSYDRSKITTSVQEARKLFDNKLSTSVKKLANEAVNYANSNGMKLDDKQKQVFKQSFVELLANKSNYIVSKDNTLEDITKKLMSYPVEYFSGNDSSVLREQKELVKKKIELNFEQSDDPFNPVTEKNKMIYELLQELINAEAGKRHTFEDDYGEKKTIGQKSTFPKWISEDLRDKKLLDKVLDQINSGIVPTRKREVLLYNEISEVIDEIDQSFNELAQEYFTDTGEKLDITNLDNDITQDYLIKKEKEIDNEIEQEYQKIATQENDIKETDKELDRKIEEYLLNKRDNKDLYRVEPQDVTMEQAKESGISFDEWVNGQPTYYHGTNAKFDNFDVNKIGEATGVGDWGDGFYFTNRKDVARSFAEDAGGDIIMEVKLPNLKFADGNKLEKLPEIQNILDDGMGFMDMGEYLKNKGYDGVKYDHGKKGGIEYVVFDPSKIKTVTQLKAEWDKVAGVADDLTSNIKKAKQSGQSFDEWVKEQMEPEKYISPEIPEFGFMNRRQMEDFYANNQGTYKNKRIYHGTTESNKANIENLGFNTPKDKSLFFATDKKITKGYGDNVIELRKDDFNLLDLKSDKGKKLAKKHNINLDYDTGSSSIAFRSDVKKLGFDGIEYQTSKNNSDIEIYNIEKANKYVKLNKKLRRLDDLDQAISDAKDRGIEYDSLVDDWHDTRSQLKAEWEKIGGEKFRTGDIIERKTGIKITQEQRQEIEQLNKQIFGDENVDFLERLLTPQGQKALGSYKQNIIKILDGQANAKDTFWHEAVHRSMDLLSDINIRKDALKQVMIDNNIKDINQAEEILAENFIDYANKRQTFFGSIKALFDRLMYRLKKIFSFNNDKAITELYEKIFTGEIKKELKQRGFAKSVITSKKLDEVVNRNADMQYKQIHNTETIEQAKDIIAKDMNKAISRVKREKLTAINSAISMQLLTELNQKKRYDEVIDVLENISSKATNSGQAIQILGQWGRISPEGMLRYAQRLLDKTNEELNLKGLKKLKLTKEQIQEITNEIEKIQAMPEGDEKNIAISKLMDKIHSLVPSTIGEKLSYLQTIAQLLNPKTFIRNILGNFGFQQLESITDVVGVPIDMAVSLFTKKRTQTLPNLKKQYQGFSLGLSQGIKESLAQTNTLGDITQFDIANKKIFSSQWMNFFDKALRLSLQSPDRAFYKSAFEKEITNQLAINKADVITPDMVKIAHLEGLRQTFQDTNVATKFFTGVKRLLNIVGIKGFGAGDLILKYPKTPANLLVRSVEYMPTSSFASLYEVGKALVGGEFNQRNFVKGMSRAIVGTVGLVNMGFWLASIGIITGQPDEDKDIKALQNLMGIGKYRLNVSALMRLLTTLDVNNVKKQEGDKLYSYDWLQPMAIGIGIGANIALTKDTKTVDLLDTIFSSLTEGINTLAEQPLLSGLQSFKYSKDITDFIVKTLIAVPSSFVPTAVKQVRDLTDNYYRELENDPSLKKMTDSVLDKIPYLENNIPLRYNIFGQPMEKYADESNTLFNVLLNPGFVSTLKNDKVGREILDIYERTGSKTQAPRVVDKTIKGRKLTPQEVSDYQKMFGERVYKEYSKLISSSGWSTKDDEEKIKAMVGKMTDINKEVKKELFGIK